MKMCVKIEKIEIELNGRGRHMNENIDVPVMAMYDVRGIQEYIFRKNEVKEIIGASRLVNNIISDALEDAAEKMAGKGSCIFGWKGEDAAKDHEKLRFMDDPEILIQVLFIGGGNAYVLYRTGELCEKINREMAKTIMKKTYSLQLATASVKVTEDYLEDYKQISEKMKEIKTNMPYTSLLGTLPVVQRDAMTGFPIAYKEKEEKYSQESRLKRNCYVTDEDSEKEFDKLITQKGDDSTMAIVHMDGNNMGRRIRSIMGMDDSKKRNKKSKKAKNRGQLDERDSYTINVEKIRGISETITTSFEETYQSMQDALNQWIQGDQTLLKKNGIYLRKIVVAGDDITFVCNAKIALSLVEFFCKDISQKKMKSDASSEMDQLDKFGFSVCAGIAYVHSHFPFSTGYEVAEACCAKAKEKAKQSEHSVKIKNKTRYIGNWVDFQICKSVHTMDLESKRQKDYQLPDGSYLLKRPYYIPTLKVDRVIDKKNEQDSFEGFKAIFRFFTGDQDGRSFPRSLAKAFRNTYPSGEDSMRALVSFAKSRQWTMLEVYPEPFSDNVASWYDALEMMDLYVDMINGKEE